MSKTIRQIIKNYSFIDFFELRDFNIKGKITYPFIRVQIENLEFQSMLASSDISWSISLKNTRLELSESNLHSFLIENNVKKGSVDNLLQDLYLLFKKEPVLFKEGIIYKRKKT